MKLNAENVILSLGATLFIAGAVSAATSDNIQPSRNLENAPTYTASGTMSKQSAVLLTNLLRNPHLKVKAVVGSQTANAQASKSNINPTYTASGTMSRTEATLLTNLLRNPHLKVKAIVGNPVVQKPKQPNPMDVMVTYTIKGTTDRQTVLKLKKLLQNSDSIKISMQANVNLPSKFVNQQQPLQRNQYQVSTRYISAYTPFYYNGRPPVYLQGNTVWYPVPVVIVPTDVTQAAPYPMDYTLKVAGK